MKISKIIFGLILTIGIVLILNGIRLFFSMNSPEFDEPQIIMMLYGTIWGIIFIHLGKKGLKNPDSVSVFWKWILSITITVAVILLIITFK